MCQALEVYSDQYWNDESSKIVKEGIQTGKTNDKRITLRIRLIDLFKKYSEILDLLDEDLSMISKNISTIRNYYTHYSDDRRKELETYINIKMPEQNYKVLTL